VLERGYYVAGSLPIVYPISVLWGGLLCGLGYWVSLAGMATYKSRMAAADGVAVLPGALFVTAMLITLVMFNLLWISADAADLFDWADLLDWIDN
jgi:hypothetical protein